MIFRPALSFLLLTNLIFLQGCLSEPDECDVEKSKQVFNSAKAQYDKRVLSRIATYNQFKDLLLSNADTIFSFNRNRGGNPFSVTHDSFKDSITAITFYSFGKRDMLEDQVPPSFAKEFMSIYKQLESEKGFSIRLSSNHTVEISLNSTSDFDDDNIGVVHRLSWNEPSRNLTEDANLSALQRDTVLVSHARYTVFVHCYRGW